MTFAEQMDKAAESSLAKLVFRIGTPVALGIGAYFFQQMQTDLKGMNNNFSVLQSDLRYTNARIDERVIRTLDAQGRRLDNHDDRLRVIETDVQVLRNAVRTP